MMKMLWSTLARQGTDMPYVESSPAVATATIDRAGATAAQKAPRSLPWRSIITQASLMWLGSRFILVAATFFALALLPHAPAPADPNASLSLHELAAAWQRHDAFWYLRIAQGGYQTEQMTAFFPLYPLLIWLVAFVTGGHWLAASLIVSNLGALGVFIAIGALGAYELGEKNAWRTILFTMAYPLAFFLAAPLTESLFLTLAALCLLSMRRGYWWWAAGLAFLAGLTRPTGAILVLPLLWEYGRQHGWWRRDFWRGGAWRKALQMTTFAELAALVAAVPLAIGALALVAWVRFGHPLLVLNSHSIYWVRHKAPIWETLFHATGYMLAHPLSFEQALAAADVVPVLVAIVLVVAMARRLPLAYTLYMLGLLYLTVSTPVTNKPVLIESSGRFLIVSIPIVLGLARWARQRPWLEYLIVYGGFTLQTIFLAFFLMNGWLV